MLRIGQIMNRNVFSVAAASSLDEAALSLVTAGVSGAPVRDANGKVVGMIARADLTDPERMASSGSDDGSLTVEDVMTPGFAVVHETDSVMETVRSMVRERVHRALVLDGEDHLVGIVTPTDVVRALVQSTEHAPEATPERVTIH